MTLVITDTLIVVLTYLPTRKSLVATFLIRFMIQFWVIARSNCVTLSALTAFEPTLTKSLQFSIGPLRLTCERAVRS